MSCNEAAIVRVCKGPDDFEPVAKDCGVDDGFFNFGPFRSANTRETVCAKLFAMNFADRGKRLYDSMDAKMSAFLHYVMKIDDKPNANLETFNGEVVDCVFALIYLLQKPNVGPQVCMMLGPLQRALVKYEKNKTPIQFPDVAITWGYDIYRRTFGLHFPGRSAEQYVKRMQECLRSRRFFFSLMALYAKPKTQMDGTILRQGHALTLFYDKETGILERFDPYQSSDATFNTAELDRELQRLFKVLPGYQRFVSPPSMPYQQRAGLQYRAEIEREKKAGDPGGFCVPWSVLYAEARLTSPLQNPESIPELLEIWARKNQVSLTCMIRNFTSQMEQLKLETYRQFLRADMSNTVEAQDLMYATVLKQLKEHTKVLHI